MLSFTVPVTYFMVFKAYLPTSGFLYPVWGLYPEWPGRDENIGLSVDHLNK